MESEEGCLNSLTEIADPDNNPVQHRWIHIISPEGGPKACELLSKLSSLGEEEDEEK